LLRSFFASITCGLLILLVTSGGAESQMRPCDEPSSVQRETYQSYLLGQEMYYSVYLPPCYDETATPYPIAYLMHGSNEDDGHWLRLGLQEELDTAIFSGELAPFVVVLPFGNVIANRNRFDAISWSNIFLQELMPTVESSLNVQTTQAGRAIGGISRGGFWAYQIAFRQPTLFSTVGGHSAFFDLYHAPEDQNPLHLVLTVPELENLRLWLDYGADDFAAPGLDEMHIRLDERGLAHTFMQYDEGQHNNTYWSTHLGEYLRFYGEGWQQETSQTTPAPGNFGGFATNTPAAPVTTTPEVNNDEGRILFPIVAFPSLQTSITMAALQAIAAGEYDERLVVDETTVTELAALGFDLHPDTRIVQDGDIRNQLWGNPDRYALLPLEHMTPQTRIIFVDDRPVLDQLESYPFDDGNSAGITRITLSGVTALARNTRLALDENGVEWAASGISEYVSAADFFHMSNEVSIVESCPNANGDLLGGNNSLCTKPDHFALLSLLDVDIVELTGNHNNDYGYDAYHDTLAAYQAENITTVGGGATTAQARSPLRFSHEGNLIGWIACNAVGPYYALVNEEIGQLGGLRPGAADCDWEWLETEIPALAAEVDVLIVTVQHQEIEEYQPTEAQRIDFHRLANLGADVVMGTAAHKPQTYEFYPTSRRETAFIHYGMGNLYFDQPFWGNMRFFMNTLYLYQGEVHSVEIFPGIIEDAGRPHLMTLEERENFLFFMFREQNGF